MEYTVNAKAGGAHDDAVEDRPASFALGVARGLALAAFLMLLLEAAVTWVRFGGLRADGVAGFVWLLFFALGFLPALRGLRPRRGQPTAWSVTVFCVLFQSLSYAAATMSLLLLALLREPYRFFG